MLIPASIYFALALALALALLEVAHDGQTMQLLKLRNPWGCTEWEGEWSDAWINANAPERIKRKLGWKVRTTTGSISPPPFSVDLLFLEKVPIVFKNLLGPGPPR